MVLQAHTTSRTVQIITRLGKCNLRPLEWQVNRFNSTLIVPRFGIKRIFNKVSAIGFIAKAINIPLLKVYSCLENDGATYLAIGYIEGITINNLDVAKRKLAEKEVESQLETMRRLRSLSLV